MVRTPDRPATSPAQVAATSLPSGVTAPMPVTTTRGAPSASSAVIGRACPVRTVAAR